MKTITVRLPDDLAAELEAEARKRGVSKSDIVRERLQRARKRVEKVPPGLEAIADLIGSVDDGLPPDASARINHYLKVKGFGRNRTR